MKLELYHDRLHGYSFCFVLNQEEDPESESYVKFYKTTAPEELISESPSELYSTCISFDFFEKRYETTTK